MGAMSSDAILPAIHARLAAALATPHPRYRPFVVDGAALGALDDARADRLRRFPALAVSTAQVAFAPLLARAAAAERSAALADVALTLRAEGALPAWRDELYAVAPAFGAPAAFLLERGAARWFGVRTYAAHVNGATVRAGRTHLWFSRRSPAKAVDPGMLDNLVGGGIAAGAGVRATVVREAWEEAGIAAHVAARAQAAGVVHVRRALPDGLQDEVVFVHDLALPDDFVPANQDGEAVEHRLVDAAAAARLIAVATGADAVTVDASLVVLDFLLRHGAFTSDAPAYAEASALRLASMPLA